MVFAIHVALLIVAFLVALNGFLRGRRKPEIYIVLVALWAGLLTIMLAAFGQKEALLALLLSGVYVSVSRPIAARVAASVFRSMSGSPSGPYVGLPPQELKRLSQQLEPSQNLQHALQEVVSGKYDEALDALIDYCERNPPILEVMEQIGVSGEDLRDLYHKLQRAGAGQWRGGHYVSASTLAYPDALHYAVHALPNAEGDGESVASALCRHFEHGAPLPALETEPDE